MEKKRTNQQNAALHLMFEHLAQELNDHGLDMVATLKEHPVEIPWSASTVKEIIWRGIQEKQLNKKSTTELTTKEIDQVFDTLSRWLASRHGLEIIFPSIESLIMTQRINEK